MNETENIMLMFLSTINLKSAPTYYGISANPKGEITKTTNESAVRYILYKECRGDVKLNKIFIFASNTVRNEFVGDSGKTHLQYFKDRIGEFIPNIDDCINDETIYKYDEKSSGVENMKAVVEMSERIQKYSVGKNVTLHVDLTGGMRNVNMMMLDIIRFLEYSGIKIGRLIYSQYQPRENVGYIHEIKNVYDLLQLISGVEEFINFGSVKALKDYYAICKNPISTRLQDLIDAMENFSEAIKLCRYGQFKDAIKNLHDALNDFKVEPTNLQDTLMARLIGRIRKEYGNLIATRGEDDLKIIRWCLENGYLQQALTLYTERVPEVLVRDTERDKDLPAYITKNFITVKNDCEIKIRAKLGSDNRNYGFYTLNNFDDDKGYIDAKTNVENFTKYINKKYLELLKEALNNIGTKPLHYTDLIRDIFSGVDVPMPTTFLQKEDFLQDGFKINQQLETLNKIWKTPEFLMDTASIELEPFKELVKVLVYPSTAEPSVEKVIKSNNYKFETNTNQFSRRKKFFNACKNDIILRKFFSSFKTDMRIFRIKYMAENGVFIVDKISNDKFFSIMEKYFVIKDERNHSNHARPDEIGEFYTAKDLEEFMKEGLEEIEQC